MVEWRAPNVKSTTLASNDHHNHRRAGSGPFFLFILARGVAETRSSVNMAAPVTLDPVGLPVALPLPLV